MFHALRLLWGQAQGQTRGGTRAWQPSPRRFSPRWGPPRTRAPLNLIPGPTCPLGGGAARASRLALVAPCCMCTPLCVPSSHTHDTNGGVGRRFALLSLPSLPVCIMRGARMCNCDPLSHVTRGLRLLWMAQASPGRRGGGCCCCCPSGPPLMLGSALSTTYDPGAMREGVAGEGGRWLSLKTRNTKPRSRRARAAPLSRLGAAAAHTAPWRRPPVQHTAAFCGHQRSSLGGSPFSHAAYRYLSVKLSLESGGGHSAPQCCAARDRRRCNKTSTTAPT